MNIPKPGEKVKFMWKTKRKRQRTEKGEKLKWRQKFTPRKKKKKLLPETISRKKRESEQNLMNGRQKTPERVHYSFPILPSLLSLFRKNSFFLENNFHKTWTFIFKEKPAKKKIATVRSRDCKHRTLSASCFRNFLISV